MCFFFMVCIQAQEILIVLLWFNIMYYCSTLFYQSTIICILVQNFIVYCKINKHFDWWTHEFQVEMVWCTPVISILLSESRVFIMLLCQLYSTHYRAVQMKSCSKSTSVNNVATLIWMVMCTPVIRINYHLK